MLIEELQKEIERNKKLIKIYQSIPTGAFGAAMINKDVETAELAIYNLDTVQIIRSLQTLRRNKA